MSNENKIMSSGGFIPSVANTPLDLRTRVQTINDIYNIEPVLFITGALSGSLHKFLRKSDHASEYIRS